MRPEVHCIRRNRDNKSTSRDNRIDAPPFNGTKIVLVFTIYHEETGRYAEILAAFIIDQFSILNF